MHFIGHIIITMTNVRAAGTSGLADPTGWSTFFLTNGLDSRSNDDEDGLDSRSNDIEDDDDEDDDDEDDDDEIGRHCHCMCTCMLSFVQSMLSLTNF